VALQLKRRGAARIRPLQGGLDAWMARRFPVDALRPAPAAPPPGVALELPPVTPPPAGALAPAPVPRPASPAGPRKEDAEWPSP
jgi:hypothetical protein